MRTRSILKRGVIVAASLLAALLAMPAAAETTWKIQIWGPKRASTEPFEWYAKEVTAKTGGQIKFDIVYDKGKVTDSAEMLKAGAADGAFVCAQYFAKEMPLVSVLDLPLFSPENVSVQGRVELALADHPAIDAELRKWNIKMLLPAPLPQYQIMGMRRLAKVDDFQGAKVRISAEMGRVLAEYGATSSTIASTDAAAALKEGKLDMVALPYPYAFATYKVDDVAKYVTDKISLGAGVCYMGANQKSWDALPAGVKKVMLDLRAPAVARYEQTYAADDAARIAGFKAKGLEFVSFSPADRTRLVAKAIKIWNAWVDEREKQGMPGREVFEFTQAKIREYGRK